MTVAKLKINDLNNINSQLLKTFKIKHSFRKNVLTTFFEIFYDS